MDVIRIDRNKLLETLRENRDRHEAEFKEARGKWVKKSAKALRKAAERAEKGDIEEHPLANLPKPVSYVKSYDDAIARVEYDTRSEIELDDREFSAWVQDDWNWRGQFVGTTSLYNNR